MSPELCNQAPQSNAFATVRSCYAQDELAAAVVRGATQYVVLGARQEMDVSQQHPRLRIFQVARSDHQSLRSDLTHSGFQSGEISFFSWLGATVYRTAEAVLATLAFIGSMPEGSSVAFDYAADRSSPDAVEQMALDPLASRIVSATGPSRFFLDSAALHRLLRIAGFHQIEDIGPAEIGQRYSVGQTVAHLVSASV